MQRLTPGQFIRIVMALRLPPHEVVSIIKPEALPESWPVVAQLAVNQADEITPSDSTLAAHVCLMEIVEFANEMGEKQP